MAAHPTAQAKYYRLTNLGCAAGTWVGNSRGVYWSEECLEIYPVSSQKELSHGRAPACYQRVGNSRTTYSLGSIILASRCLESDDFSAVGCVPDSNIATGRSEGQTVRSESDAQNTPYALAFRIKVSRSGHPKGGHFRSRLWKPASSRREKMPRLEFPPSVNCGDHELACPKLHPRAGLLRPKLSTPRSCRRGKRRRPLRGYCDVDARCPSARGRRSSARPCTTRSPSELLARPSSLAACS
jgi:hypothetical protein